MKKLTILFLIAAVLGTYLILSPSKENPIAKTILSAELSTGEGRANFAKKLQPHLDALSAKWQAVESLQKEVNTRIAAYEKEPTEAQKTRIEEGIAAWKKATDEATPFLQIVEAGQNALEHPDKVIALATELQKKEKLSDGDLRLLGKVAEICK